MPNVKEFILGIDGKANVEYNNASVKTVDLAEAIVVDRDSGTITDPTAIAALQGVVWGGPTVSPVMRDTTTGLLASSDDVAAVRSAVFAYEGVWASRPLTGLTVGDLADFTDVGTARTRYRWSGTRWQADECFSLLLHSCPVGLPPTSEVGANGALTLGTKVGGGTITFSATSGAGVTCTASAAAFAATDVGRVIAIESQTFTITAYTSTTVVTGTFSGAISGVGPHATWFLSWPFNRVLSRGVWLYFPAGGLYAGSLAGSYWTVMSSTVKGTVYDVRLPATIQPYWYTGTLTPIVSASIGQVSLTTGTDYVVATMTVRGDLIGPYDLVSISTMYSGSATTNGKRTTINYGSIGLSTVMLLNGVTGAGRIRLDIQQQGSQSAQIAHHPAMGYGSSSPGSNLFGLTNVAADFTVGHSLSQITAATDWVLVETARVDLIPGVL